MSSKTTDWIQTHSGKLFYPLEPDIELIDIDDIAHALSHECRFAGHCNRFYSVAEHSLWCLEVARLLDYNTEVRRACLMHDAAEAYFKDMPRPIKHSFEDYAVAEAYLLGVIWAKYDLKVPPVNPKVVSIDDAMLATEREQLFTNPKPWPSVQQEPLQALSLNLNLKGHDQIKAEFLDACGMLKIG